ncbi:MAG: putative thioredoxin [Actinomycetota bacterium]|jgi:putative thioredoxin
MADVTDATFEQAVLDRSVDVPVVVDLWAEWCGPCRTLGPILEKVIDETAGAVELVKVDVDANPQVSAAFQVQSIPAVFAIKDRKVVDSFIGALPEQQVRAWVQGLAPPPSEADQLADAGDEASLRAALEIESDHPLAVTRLADLLVARGGDGDTEEALSLLARVPESAETRRIAALARTGAAEVPDDVDERLQALLDRVKTDEAARQEYVDLLEVLGPDDPRTADYRKQLTTRLF